MVTQNCVDNATGFVSGGSANNILYQTAANTTGFVSSANSSVLLSDSNYLPTLQSTAYPQMFSVDGTTLTCNNNIFSAVGSAIAITQAYYTSSFVSGGTTYLTQTMNTTSPNISTYSWTGTGWSSATTTSTSGSNAQGNVVFTISGTLYLTVAFQGSNIIGTYTWSGSAWGSESTVSTGSTPRRLSYIEISGTPTLLVTLATGMQTYQWVAGAWSHITGADVSLGTGNRFALMYQIAGTTYAVLCQSAGTQFTYYSWTGSVWSSINSVSTGASSAPWGATVYQLNGTYYLTIGAPGIHQFITYSWNGSAWGSAAPITVPSTNPVCDIQTYFNLQGNDYLVTGTNTAGGGFYIYKWNGSAWTSYANHALANVINSYFLTIGGVGYIILNQSNSNLMSTYEFSFGNLTCVYAPDIYGGAKGSLPYQTAANTTAFAPAVNNSILIGNSSGVPTFSTTMPQGVGFSYLISAPSASSTVTSGFVTSLTAGTAVQNTSSYDIICNITVTVSLSTTATIVCGVGSTSTPTTDTVVPSFTVAASTAYTFSVAVPKNYYLLVDTTGTITVSSITVQSSGL